jgi:prepilin-type N-terminal cleavage/methylation domain-containing protein
MRDRQAGFTLIEMMVTVVVISILAAIALPSFFGETRKAKAMAEVQPMFNDLRVRLEQYLQEQGTYPASLGETTLHPVGTPSVTPVDINPLPATWQDLKVRISGPDRVRCGYTWVTGGAGSGVNIGSIAKAAAPLGFGFAAPPASWYYLLAKCDMDGTSTAGDDTTFSWYFTSSVDPTIQKLNEGR